MQQADRVKSCSFFCLPVTSFRRPVHLNTTHHWRVKTLENVGHQAENSGSQAVIVKKVAPKSDNFRWIFNGYVLF
jgi:hypothetical protein